nr:hypothetical protein HK105_000154 [Polyrhizophydium stewartii]
MTELERNVLAFTAGLALALMAYSIWDNIVESAHIKEAEDRPKPRPAKPEDAISIEALAELAMTGNIQLQESATSILLDRAMSEEHLSYIMRACTVRNHPRLLKIAIHTVHQLAQIEDNRPVLIRMRALKILVHLLAIMGVNFCLTKHGAERRKTRMVHYGVVKPLMAILSEDRKPNSDLKYFALTLLHQISLRDDLHPALIEANAIEVLVKLTRESFTNSSMQKLCLHSLVRIVSAVPVEANDHGPISEDYELVSWAILLLHEFAVKDIAKDQIASISGLFKAIAYCLSNNETVIARVTLRIVKSLCTENTENADRLASSDVVNLIINLCNSPDHDVQYAGVALILNASTLSPRMVRYISEKNGIEIVDAFLRDNQELSLQIVATKALVTIAEKDPSLRFQITCTNVRNLLSCLFILVDTESFDHVDQSKGESALLEYISDVLDETCSALLDLLALPLVDRSYMDLTSPVSARTPLAYPPLPSVPSATDENAPAKNKAFSADVESAEAHGNEPPMANPPRTASSEPSHEELGQQIASGQLLPGGPVTEHSEIEDIKADIATNSLRCVSRLFRYAPVKELMIREKLVALLIGLCGLPRKELSQQAFATLALCIKQGLPIQELLSIPMAFITILKFVVTENAQALYFHLNLMLEHACRFGPMPYEPSGAMLRNAVYTPGLVIAHSTQELRSDGWKFCSLRVALGVTGGGRYSYDFVIRTSNIMQIGWASEKCHFNSEAGTGVGDDEHSYAYDGHRMKRWHAELDNNSYGRSWSPGDTVTSVIDLDQCTITYYLNGESMGVAFESIDPWQTWYPAVSLSSDQMGLFRFGGKLDPLSSMSPKHREKDVHSADTEIETAPALSLYFEVQIDLDDLPAAECAQVGVLLQDTHMIAACMHRRSRTLVWLKIQGVHYSNDNVLSTQITEYLDANLEDIDPDASEPVADADGEAPLPDGVEIVHKMAGADWQTGDWVGCGVYLHQRTVFFTWNGVLQGPEISPASGGNEAACLPYVRGVPHFTINLSETPFKWAAANADRFCVLAWPP